MIIDHEKEKKEDSNSSDGSSDNPSDSSSNNPFDGENF